MSLQSCLTLCDPIDGSPPGSPVHGIFQARVLEFGAIASPVVTLTTGKNASGNLGSKRLYCLSNGYNASGVRSSATFKSRGQKDKKAQGPELVEGALPGVREEVLEGKLGT